MNVSAAGALALALALTMGDVAPPPSADITLAAGDKQRIEREKRELHHLDKKRERQKGRAAGREAERARSLRKQRESERRAREFEQRREAIESLTEEPPAK